VGYPLLGYSCNPLVVHWVERGAEGRYNDDEHHEGEQHLAFHAPLLTSHASVTLVLVKKFGPKKGG